MARDVRANGAGDIVTILVSGSGFGQRYRCYDDKTGLVGKRTNLLKLGRGTCCKQSPGSLTQRFCETGLTGAGRNNARDEPDNNDFLPAYSPPLPTVFS